MLRMPATGQATASGSQATTNAGTLPTNTLVLLAKMAEDRCHVLSEEEDLSKLVR